jgi:benzoylformate decarboxylase
MTVMAGRQAIMEIFRAEGVDYIFGNPGTTELGFMDMLQDYPQLQYIVCLQESIALGAAQMYANASGKTGVVNLHVAPGLGNALGALYNAAIGKMPLLVTAGQQDSRMVVREPVLSYDLVSMAKPLAKWSVQLQHVEEIPVIFPRAFKVAQDAPRGPVFIALPGNVIDAEADFTLPGASVSYRRNRPDPEGIAAAADLLAKAQHPVIVCGGGIHASQAEAELVQVAEMLGAHVWTTVLVGALGFPNMHPHFRGSLPGESDTIRRSLGDADVVLAVGADLFDEVFYNEGSPLPDGCALIHVDNSSWEIGKNLPTAVGILADPKLALQELSEVTVPKMAGAARQAAEMRRAAMAEIKQQEHNRQAERAQRGWEAAPIAPPRLMASLRECLPDDVVIFNEAITAETDLTRTIPLQQPGSMFGNHGGGIGQGLPGAIGVKLANPDRPVVAVVGDGSAMYTIQSLWTAARYQLPILYIILSNRSYRILKLNMNRYRRILDIPSERPYPFMDLTEPVLDFVEIAHGMGVAGKRVAQPDEIVSAVQEALASGAPYLLEVMTEGRIPAQ